MQEEKKCCSGSGWCCGSHFFNFVAALLLHRYDNVRLQLDC